MRWYKLLVSFLTVDEDPVILHSQHHSCWWPGAYVTNAKKLLAKSFYQKAWLWLGDALASANHSQAFC